MSSNRQDQDEELEFLGAMFPVSQSCICGCAPFLPRLQEELLLLPASSDGPGGVHTRSIALELPGISLRLVLRESQHAS
jgi:hypothetical protein